MKHSELIFLEFYQLLAKGAQITIQKNDAYSCLSLPSSSYPNFLFYPTLNVDNGKIILDEIKEKVPRGYPSVMVCSLNHTNRETIQQLKKHTAYGKFWTAMSLDLKELKQPTPRLDINIELIRDKTQLKKWTKIVEASLTGKTLNTEMFYRMAQYENVDFYLAYINSVPVATALSVRKNDDVGIFLIATLENFRKQGIGKYITEYAIWEAKKKQALFAHLQATALGKPVYAKIGFKEMGKVPVFKIA